MRRYCPGGTARARKGELGWQMRRYYTGGSAARGGGRLGWQMRRYCAGGTARARGGELGWQMRRNCAGGTARARGGGWCGKCADIVPAVRRAGEVGLGWLMCRYYNVPILYRRYGARGGVGMANAPILCRRYGARAGGVGVANAPILCRRYGARGRGFWGGKCADIIPAVRRGGGNGVGWQMHRYCAGGRNACDYRLSVCFPTRAMRNKV